MVNQLEKYMKKHNYIVILVGVCGSGKRSVGEKVAQRLEIPFFDAEKLPLSKALPEGQLPQDVDLEKWLMSIKEIILAESAKKGCVISCSVLKKEHRLLIADQVEHELDWVFMNGSYEHVVQRAEQTENHDRPAAMIKSDFEALEIPKRALTIDIASPEPENIDTILKYLARKYG